MRSGVLLIDLGVYQKVQVTDIEPLGACYVAAYLERSGIPATVLHDLGSSDDELIRAVQGRRPDVVGFSAYTSTSRRALRLARRVKAEVGCTVVFGGIHATMFPEIALDPGVDHVVLGEGEQTMLELVRALDRGEGDLDAIDGLAFERDGELVKTNPRARIADLDDLPFPRRDDLPMGRYRTLAPRPVLHRQRAASLSASRGCGFRCIFCTTPPAWRYQRIGRSVENVIEELELLTGRWGVNALYFRDEDLAFDGAWLRRMCEEIARRGMKLSWFCFARATSLDAPTLRLMKRAGCASIGFGVESADAESLERIGKGVRVDRLMHTVEEMRVAGIYSIAYLIIGFPWHTEAVIRRSFETVKSMNPDLMFLSYATPFPGTPLGRQVEEKGLLRVTDHDLYTNFDPLMDTEHMSMEEVRGLQRTLVREYYLRPRYLRGVAARIAREPAAGISLLEVGLSKLARRRLPGLA